MDYINSFILILEEVKHQINFHFDCTVSTVVIVKKVYFGSFITPITLNLHRFRESLGRKIPPRIQKFKGRSNLVEPFSELEERRRPTDVISSRGKS